MLRHGGVDPSANPSVGRATCVEDGGLVMSGIEQTQMGASADGTADGGGTARLRGRKVCRGSRLKKAG